MKLLLLVFILYIDHSVSQNITEDKRIVKHYPKKVWPISNRYIKDNDKYFHPSDTHKTPKKKREGKLKSYTVFSKPFPQSEVEMIDQIVPDSPYFPREKPTMPERRSRVKKVLPEYTIARKKRSADQKDDDRKLHTPGKQNSKIEGSAKRSKTPAQQKSVKSRFNKVSRTGSKKSDMASKTLSRSKKTKQKLLVPHNQKQKLLRPTVVRSKKLKSNKKRKSNRNEKLHQKMSHSGRFRKLKSTNKSQSNLKPAQKTLKTSAKKKAVQKLRSSDTKTQKLSRALRNATSKNIGVQDRDARRLIAGRDGLIEDYPYTVSIQRDKFHWCSGAILNPRLIITTANCLWRSKSISKMRVRVGSRHTSYGGQTAKIQEVMKHPGWKLRKAPDNDVALALLDRNIRFSHSVHGVDLPNRVMMPAFDDAWITSWGAERRDGVFEPKGMTLQVYHARLIERGKCNNVTQRFGVRVSENFICLAQTGRRAPCTRDTGAPAVSDGVLWGLASWGIRKLCGTERFPAVFSYLASQQNMDFIVNATHYLMAEERIYPFPDRYPEKRVHITTTTPTPLPF